MLLAEQVLPNAVVFSFRISEFPRVSHLLNRRPCAQRILGKWRVTRGHLGFSSHTVQDRKTITARLKGRLRQINKAVEAETEPLETSATVWYFKNNRGGFGPGTENILAGLQHEI
ncbi:hypothetical protein CEXT_127631 [Caerostris extrusa]|uniref:Uncharacterized protein n=1 Tax=Caerostris extrusa TaxID=172846 RepID=A0AAV4V657_CAEEX|nr:hypothetical protein CEXT_127631 [Caerostris extrusa]